MEIRHRDLVVSSTLGSQEWQHPWWLTPEWVVDDAAPLGEWRTTVNPGFVNGRDAFINSPVNGADNYQALTDDPQPFIRLSNWRDPAATAGISTDENDNLILLPGEGYPKYFNDLGVKPVATQQNAETASPFDNYDPDRTREIRALDIVLTIPRMGSRLDYTVLGSGSQQNQLISTVFTTDYYNAVGGRSVISAAEKYTPPSTDNSIPDIYGTLLNDGSGESDQIKIATLYMVSVPNAGAQAMPDPTWEPYPAYDVFWNLNSATNIVPPAPNNPINLSIPLAAGLAQPVIDSLLAFTNDNNAAATAFLQNSNATGHQWTY